MARLAAQSIDHLLSLVQNDPDPFIPFKVRYTALGRPSVVWGTVLVHCAHTHHTIPYCIHVVCIQASPCVCMQSLSGCLGGGVRVWQIACLIRDPPGLSPRPRGHEVALMSPANRLPGLAANINTTARVASTLWNHIK